MVVPLGITIGIKGGSMRMRTTHAVAKLIYATCIWQEDQSILVQDTNRHGGVSISTSQYSF